MKPVKPVFSLQKQIKSCITLLILADTFIKKLKTKFNRLLQNGLKYKNNS